MPLQDGLRGLQAILNGEVDELSEGSFYMIGGLDSALEKAKKK